LGSLSFLITITFLFFYFLLPRWFIQAVDCTMVVLDPRKGVRWCSRGLSTQASCERGGTPLVWVTCHDVSIVQTAAFSCQICGSLVFSRFLFVLYVIFVSIMKII
jgi:hypothetical protein